MSTMPRGADAHADTTTNQTDRTEHNNPAVGVVTYQDEVVRSPLARKLLAGLRIVLGFTFVWAFVDKLFGLGYATPGPKAWINGGTPAQGFMKHAEGPFASFFSNIAMMYLAQFPLGAAGMTNPLVDSHWIEALGIGVVAATLAGDTWGLGRWWGRHVGNGILR